MKLVTQLNSKEYYFPFTRDAKTLKGENGGKSAALKIK